MINCRERFPRRTFEGLFGGGSIDLLHQPSLPGIDLALETRDEEDAGDGLARQSVRGRRTLSHVLTKVGNRPPDDRRCRAPATIVELVSRAGL